MFACLHCRCFDLHLVGSIPLLQVLVIWFRLRHRYTSRYVYIDDVILYTWYVLVDQNLVTNYILFDLEIINVIFHNLVLSSHLERCH